MDSSTPTKRRPLLTLMAAALALAICAVFYLEGRQITMLQASVRTEHDSLVWSMFQLEVEYLKLQGELQHAIDKPGAASLETLKTRYEIFVSRLGVIAGEQASDMMQEDLAYQQALAQVRGFVLWFDAQASRSPGGIFDDQLLHNTQQRMAELYTPIRDLSLRLSQHLAAQATQRIQLIRDQSKYSIGLTIFQCVLTLAFAFLALQQFKRLDARRKALETLAANLSEARTEAEAANRAKSVFLANMSHEVRTPLHGLLGMLSLLKDTPLSDQQQDQVATASESARHLLVILNDILDMSKLESGSLEMHAEPLELPRLMSELESLMLPQAQGKQLALQLSLAPNVPRWVMADGTRVRQILLNLLSNAIKFCETGAVSLSVTQRSDEAPSEDGDAAKPTSMLCFTVIDTGIGMDAATQNRLFERFSQGDSSTSRRFGGTGLGLEISRNLARRMGGDIRVTSALDLGSTFIVELPLPACEPGKAPEAAAVKINAARGLRVLVSEDHEINRKYLEAVLQRLGHTACFCHNGKEALKALEREDFDIVLMDLHTPVMDGLTATEAIRALPAPKSQVRIIALTADAFEESRQRALKSGMDDFLAKPVQIADLQAMLQRHSPVARTEAPVSRTDPLPAIDQQTLNQVRSALPPETFNKLLQAFLHDEAQSLPNLERALRDQSRSELRQTAHSVKGAALSLGLLVVSRPAMVLEQLPADAPPAAAEHAIRELRVALGQARRVCEEMGLLTAA